MVLRTGTSTSTYPNASASPEVPVEREHIAPTKTDHPSLGLPALTQRWSKSTSRRQKTSTVPPGNSIALNNLPANVAPAVETNAPSVTGTDTTEKQPAITIPKGYKGEVTRSNDGLVSSSPVIRKLLAFAAKSGCDLKAIDLNTGRSLGLEPPSQIIEGHKAFREACTVKTLHYKNGQSTEADVNLSLTVLMRVLKEGKSAFADGATIPGRDGQLQHPYDFLRDLGTSVVSDNEPLKDAIENALKTDPDASAKLAATWLYKIETKKEFNKDGVYAWFASLGAGAGFGTALEKVVLDLPKQKIFGKDFDPMALPSATRAGLAFWDALPAVFVETLDATIVKKFLDKIDGGSWKPTMEDLKEGLQSGVIAGFAAMPFNTVEYFKTGSPVADQFIKLFANQLAIFGAGSIIPMNLKKNGDQMDAAIVESIGSEFMARVPAGQDPRKFIQDMRTETMKVSPGSSVSQKALAVTCLLGLIPFLAENLAHAPKEVLDILQRTIFNPVEATAINSSILLAQYFGLGDLITTDGKKNEQLFELVLDKQKQDGEKAKITTHDLRAISEPPGELLARVGRLFQSGFAAAAAFPELFYEKGRKTDYASATRGDQMV
ncbi:hypothetical protein [Paraburkholderia sp. CI3]|uniref:hypothetical protein n=1 Tax=Paraburkholderia sp. CI3 TaxID=2991060 RepID=UPI003D1C6046